MDFNICSAVFEERHQTRNWLFVVRPLHFLIHCRPCDNYVIIEKQTVLVLKIWQARHIEDSFSIQHTNFEQEKSWWNYSYKINYRIRTNFTCRYSAHVLNFKVSLTRSQRRGLEVLVVNPRLSVLLPFLFPIMSQNLVQTMLTSISI